jgi:hypothetical protein
MTDHRRDGVVALLGRVTMTALRRRSRERDEPDQDVPPPAARLSTAPEKTKKWWRFILQPLGVVFLGLGAATTFSLVFAARRLGDDGSLSALDWFRLTIVGIIALTFFGRIFATLGRLPPVRQIRRALRRPAEPRTLATIPHTDTDELAPDDAAFGRMTPVEWAKVKTQMRLDDAFWVAVNLALLIFGGIALYGLGSSAVREIVTGEAGAWSFLRVAMAAMATFGLVRLLRGSIAQLRLRRQRRRKRATKRLLRYLLWWDSPPVAATTSRPGAVRYAIAAWSPLLISLCIAAGAAAYSPWGEPPADVPGEQASLDAEDRGSSSLSPSSSTLVPDVLTTPVREARDASRGATTTVDPLTTTVDPLTTTVGSPTTTEAPTTTTASLPTSVAPSTTASTVTPSTTTASLPTSVAPPTTASTVTPSTTTASPPTSVAPPTITSTVAPTTVAPTTTAPTTVAPTTTTSTTTSTTTTTVAPTTTTEPPAPLMVVNSLSHTFTCNGGTTAYIVAWSVSGDPGGRVNIFRLKSGGSFQQIGFNESFAGNLFDQPPGSGNYQYWVIAANSDNVDTVRKDPGSGFFASNGTCID